MPYDVPFDQPEVPGIYIRFNNSLAVGEAAAPHRVVVIGTRLSSGTVAAELPRLIRRSSEAAQYWGIDSMIAAMAREALAQYNNIELWGVGVDELVGGTAAAGAVAISGTATASGTLSFFVGDVRIRVPVIKDQTATTVINNAVAAADEEPELHVAAANNANTSVSLTAKWKGASGNYIDIRLDPDTPSVPGLTVTVTAMTGGTNDPEIDAALVALGDDSKFDTVICGYEDAVNIGHLDAWLEPRWGELVQLDGHAVVASTKSFADLLTLASSLNTKFVTVVAAGPTPTPPWVVAAQVGAADAEVTKRQPNEPREGIVLRNCVAPKIEARFSLSERDTLLANGISTTKGSANGALVVERLVTTYTQDQDGFPDESYKDIGTMRTLGRLRYDLIVWRARQRQKLVSQDPKHNQFANVMTPDRLRASLTVVYEKWIQQTLCQDSEFFAANLQIAVDTNKTDFLVFLPVKLVYGLNVVAAELAHI